VREVVESDLLKEKAVKWLEEHATIELVPKGSLAKEEEETEGEDIQIEAIAQEEIDASTQTIDVEAEPSTQTIDVEAEPSAQQE
jgi:trigger factor